MNFWTNTSINKKSNAFVKVLSAFIFLLIFIGVLNIFQNPIKNFWYLVSSPVEKYFWNAGNNASVFFTSFINARNIAKENENLKLENQNFLVEIASFRALEKENEALGALTVLVKPKEYKFVTSAVTGLNIVEDIISIDKGSVDGILKGMPVISEQKVVFGKVLKVYKNFSEVMLISNKNNVLNVKIQNSDQNAPPIYGVVRGSGNLGIYLDLIPIDSNIKKGDVLITSSLEETFPKDLLTGRVDKTDKNDLKPFQTIKIKPFFNIKEAEILFVITDYKQKD